MNEDLLMRLSNADAIASRESEVRDILYDECKSYCDDIQYDNLGSIIFHKKSDNCNGLKIMFLAHMDEVGFLVRHISDIGFLYLICVGGVLDKSKEMQMVRVTTKCGKKIKGILNVSKNENGSIKDIYVDIGVDTANEVEDLGIEIGDMVCFDSECTKMSNGNVFAGKSMDNRAGCYVISEALKYISNKSLKNEIYMCGTSSEEVGLRGAKTVTYQINPDIVFAIDVANNPELIKNYTNHRLIGKGCMIVHYDKTMIPNEKLLSFVKDIAKNRNINYQCDMFSGGGTDVGNSHLDRSGKLALVIGIPIRYCHSSWSLIHKSDLDDAIKLVCELSTSLTNEIFNEFTNFKRR